MKSPPTQQLNIVSFLGAEQSRGAPTRRVVQEGFDLSSAVAVFLEVDLQQVL